MVDYTFYDKSFYDKSLYGILLTSSEPTIFIGLTARIVKPHVPSPPIIDTVARGLAERFDYLQHALQVMQYMNKIGYAFGLDLDNIWGELYECPRNTSESDEHYRCRLQTRIAVITSCGTIPNCQAVIDHLIAVPGGAQIESLWPARAIVNFTTIEALRGAKSNLSLLNNVLPDLFAAGIDFEICLSFSEVGLKAAILGDATLNLPLRAAIQVEQELLVGLDTLIAFVTDIPIELDAAIEAALIQEIPLKAAIQGENLLEVAQRAAIRGDVTSQTSLYSAIQADRILPTSLRSAVEGQNYMESGIYSAIAHSFEIQSAMLALCVLVFELSTGLYAAIEKDNELTTSLKARIARKVP